MGMPTLELYDKTASTVHIIYKRYCREQYLKEKVALGHSVAVLLVPLPSTQSKGKLDVT